VNVKGTGKDANMHCLTSSGKSSGCVPRLSCWLCRCSQRCKRRQPILLKIWRREASVSQHHSRELARVGSTDVAVATKHSTLFALAMTTSTTENNTVDATRKLSLAIGERMKKRMDADMVGNREARIVLRASMIA
jgi:hypothetical protein